MAYFEDINLDLNTNSEIAKNLFKLIQFGTRLEFNFLKLQLTLETSQNTEL